MSLPPRAPALAALLLLLAVPAPARAEFWAAVSGGVAFPTGTTTFGKLDVQPVGALSVGYDLAHAGASLWVGFLSTRSGAVFEESSVPVLARIRGRLPLGVAVPFVYGAAGVAPSRATVSLVQYEAVAFAAQAGGGLDLVFGDMFTLGVEGGWQWLAPSFGFGTVKLDGGTLLATMALRFG